MQGLLGKKLGMTRIFDGDGQQIPVTVIEVGPCVVVQCKTKENDGYAAFQIGFSEQREHRVTKPLLGRFKAAGVKPMQHLREFLAEEGDAYKVGDSVTATIFKEGEFVDLMGTTKGLSAAVVTSSVPTAPDR